MRMKFLNSTPIWILTTKNKAHLMRVSCLVHVIYLLEFYLFLTLSYNLGELLKFLFYLFSYEQAMSAESCGWKQDRHSWCPERSLFSYIPTDFINISLSLLTK